MKYNIWVFIWETTEIFYKFTGMRLQTPIEVFFPDFCPWLFGKMTGCKGMRKK